MPRIALGLMYDGTAFNGWQRQPNGRTVQEELERMLGRLAGDRPVSIMGAGRTDSGVHAHGQVAHADIESRYDDAGLLHALRRMSPPDIAVLWLRTVSPEFHARYKACARSYRYSIITHPDPFRARYAWMLDMPLELAVLNAAAVQLMGTHDYTALSKHNPDTPNSVCAISHAEWVEGENGLEFHITADRFLYGMVRLLVGIQIDVALGRRTHEEIADVRASGDRNRQSAAAPAQGLSLVRVEYPEEWEIPAAH